MRSIAFSSSASLRSLCSALRMAREPPRSMTSAGNLPRRRSRNVTSTITPSIPRPGRSTTIPLAASSGSMP
ncbi:MAG: hypothetical protein RXP91_06415 [Nitrososphaeria archaeon]